MTDDTKKIKEEALRKWYSQKWVLDSIKRVYEAEDWEEVEASVHRNVLYPLGKHDQLPDYMRTEEGNPLFPSNLNPMNDQEGWGEAVAIGWQVMSEELGITKDEVQQHIRDEQDADWELFMDSVEKRKKERSDPKD